MLFSQYLEKKNANCIISSWININYAIPCRRCYFPTSSLTFRGNFVNLLSKSFGSGGLMCTFSEKEMAEYVKHKKTMFHNNNPHGIKKAVSVIGKQPHANIYVLGPNATFDESGNLLGLDECDVVWVSDMVSGAGVASYSLVCDVITPPSTAPLNELFNLIPRVFKHNTIPAVLMLGAACMSFHYGLIMSVKKCCPVPLAVGPSGTGKTIALRCALALFGAQNQHIYQQCTLQYYSNRCAEASIPFGIDDPSHSNELGELLLSVFNGTKRANVSRGTQKPQSCPLIAANFSLQDKATR